MPSFRPSKLAAPIPVRVTVPPTSATSAFFIQVVELFF